MKKLTFLLVLFSFVFLASCQPSYEQEAGVYELYAMEGAYTLETYSFYTLELNSDGTVRIYYQLSEFGSAVYDVTTDYSIRNQIITITSKVGFTNVKETYDYIDGEIHMIDVEIPGTDQRFTAKFRRA